MADISKEIRQIQQAARGEEVRDSITSALQKINEVAADPKWSDISNTPTTLAGYGITDAVSKESGKGLSTNDYTTAEKTKLAGIAAGAEVNVNPDWNATSGDAQILNKPTTLAGYKIGDAYTKTEVDTLIAQKSGNDLGLSVVNGLLCVTYG